MRVLMYHPFIKQRKNQLTYDNMYTACGFSGTETALMEICRYLIHVHGFSIDVIGLCEQGSYIDESSGIQFMSCDEFVSRGDYKYDWFSPLFYIDEFSCNAVLSRIDRQNTKVLIWMHCFIPDNVIHYLKHNGFHVKLACVSEWVRRHYLNVLEHENVCLVPNGVSPAMFKGTMQKNKGHWCFHAVFERGGEVAIRCFTKVRSIFPESAQKIHVMSYYTDTIINTQEEHEHTVEVHGSVSKNAIADILASSEYFMYPLVLPTNSVHHDTFACVILEALALGVIVVTWNIACIPHVYGDYVVGLDPAIDYPKDARMMTHPWFNSDEAISMMTKAVLELEMQPKKKEEIRQRGMQWARDVSRQWSSSGERMYMCLRDSQE